MIEEIEVRDVESLLSELPLSPGDTVELAHIPAGRTVVDTFVRGGSLVIRCEVSRDQLKKEGRFFPEVSMSVGEEQR